MNKNLSTREIADRLVALCRKMKWEEAQKELYAKNAVSIEPHEAGGFAKETKGLEAIEEKGRRWAAQVEKVYEIKVSDPVVATNVFACVMDMDMAMKGQDRMKMSELCVYEVKNGKIVSEHFHM
jgi:hypothetical protein